MGVWIETPGEEGIQSFHVVTPFVGVWIETQNDPQHQHQHSVTPFVGVWIETDLFDPGADPLQSHTLRGCVD